MKNFFIFAMILLISGCSLFKPRTITQTVYLEKEVIKTVTIPATLFTKCKIIEPKKVINSTEPEVFIDDLLLIINELSAENLRCFESLSNINKYQLSITDKVK